MLVPKPPNGNYLQWVMQSPNDVAAYLQAVFALQNLTVTLKVNGVETTGTLKLSAENATLRLEINTSP